ncbi:2-dehydro-3-deoxygalactonokinase [Rhodobacter calidifons]|uniref:2-dehydro-3-deoxygalactonokinase n=1 Tax=Rhodobacter calidifons TaxID=2715277 RepID=A0ABX0G582_9RHOB|nr:2-dehydro-3-deoxygalactonokinase [Rhodobacter calidifons]NHB76279.1 2-dehydro-3-deoxygalactonokinase [Rhodobacter calidifons]
MTETETPDWIAVDWGTSNLRAFAMSADGRVLAEASSDDGMGKLTRDGFEPALLRLIAPWLEGRPSVIACGMVGSRQGWCEAPYRAVPCTPLDPAALVMAPTTDPRLRVSIAPGLKQIRPADVMRGEETQIAGALHLMPGYDGVLCLPGTHSKWAHISAGEVVSFQTFMTGEMFALLSESSVLRHGMQGGGWDDAAFDGAVADALSRPERLGARLFSLRAEGLIAGLSAAAARARLSGLLIGTELAAARPYWLGQRVTLIGAETLSAAYARALAAQGVAAQRLPATDCTLAGLASLIRQTERTR